MMNVVRGVCLTFFRPRRCWRPWPVARRCTHIEVHVSHILREMGRGSIPEFGRWRPWRSGLSFMMLRLSGRRNFSVGGTVPLLWRQRRWAGARFA